MQKSILAAVAAAVFGVALQAGAQCRMTYSISVYSDGAVNNDYSAVYGYSSSIDNSTLCGCGHGGYQTTTTVYAPDGLSYANTQGGMTSSIYVPTNGRLGTYQVLGRITLYCSCAGLVAAGGIAAGVYACPFPEGEMSNSDDWFSGSDYIGGRFMMDLKDTGNADPPPGRYKGRIVSEQISELVDGCWFSGSAKLPLVAPPSSEWLSWNVTSLNKYGGDLIANPTDWVRYYQQEIAAGRAPYQSCTQTDTQAMTINGCGGGAAKQYNSHQIKVIVERNQITVFRGNGQISGN